MIHMMILTEYQKKINLLRKKKSKKSIKTTPADEYSSQTTLSMMLKWREF